MNLKQHIPNLFTLGNLLCGTLATVFAVRGAFEATAIFVVTGIVLDFFDGYLARLLKVTGALGKQLDSLADMVTSGVAPGVVMFMLLSASSGYMESPGVFHWKGVHFALIQLVGFILTLAACYRLAKFNLDTRQSEHFIGLPTPAMSLFVVSLPLIEIHTGIDFVADLLNNNYFLIGVTLVLSFLMNAELPLFSLKFKSYSLKKNGIKYLFLSSSFILLAVLHYLAVPLIVIWYVLLSVINNLFKKTS